MNRLSRAALCCMLLGCGLALSAQQQPASSTPQSAAPLVEEPKIVHVAPPSANLSLHELENEGDSLRAQKDYLDAIDYYRAGLQKEDTAVLHNKMGVALLQLSRYPEARKQFERAVKLNDHYPEAHNNLGVTHYVKRDYAGAVREYRKAIKLEGSNASFHSNLGSAYFSRQDYEQAIKEYQRAMEIDPTIFEPTPSGGVSIKLAAQGDRAYFHYMVAKMYGSKGDEQKCRFYLSKANEEGYPNVKNALKDEEFAVMRKDPDFVTFVKGLKPTQLEAVQR